MKKHNLLLLKSREEEPQVEMLERTSVSFVNPHRDNEDIDSNESLDTSDATKKARKYTRDGHLLPEKMKQFIDGIKDRQKKTDVLSEIYKKVGNIYKYNERNRYVTKANLAVEKKTARQKATGVLRAVAEAQVGGEDALNFIMLTGQAIVDIQDCTEIFSSKNLKLHGSLPPHVPFIPT